MVDANLAIRTGSARVARSGQAPQPVRPLLPFTTSAQEMIAPCTNMAYALLAVFISLVILSETALEIPDALLSVGEYVCIVGLILVELRARCVYSEVELFGALAVGVLSIQLIANGGGWMLKVAAVAFCMRRYPIEKVARCSMWVIVFWVVLIAASAILGIIPNPTVSPDWTRTNERMTFGFDWPSRVQTYLLAIFCFYIVAEKERTSLLGSAVITATSVLLYYGTDAKYPFFLLILALVLWALIRVLPSIFLGRYGVCLVICALPLLTCVVPFFLSSMYSPYDETFVALNDVLTGRLSLMSTALENRGIPLFGASMWLYQGSDYSFRAAYGYVDSGYLNVLFGYGPIVLLVVVGLLTGCMYSCAKRNLKFEVIASVLFCLYSMFYSQMLFNITYSPVPYIVAYYLLGAGKLRPAVEHNTSEAVISTVEKNAW